MPEYPYSGQDTIVDKEMFAFLDQYFDLVPGFEEMEGHHIFVYDRDKVESLDDMELIKISPYLIVYGQAIFDHGLRADEDIKRERPNVESLIKHMRERGITKGRYIDSMLDFEFPDLGEESTKHISMIANDLEGDWRINSRCAPSFLYPSMRDNDEIQQKCSELNQGTKQPFKLERILTIDASPVAVDYDADGRLYVLDTTGKVYEFERGDKTGEWQVRYGLGRSFHRDLEEEIFSPVFPNISVRDRVLFLTYGPALERHDLRDDSVETTQLQRHTGSALQLFQSHKVKEDDLWFHDVCLEDGEVFVSASLRTKTRYVLQVVDGGKYEVIYENRFPRDPIGTSPNQDLTLRLGVFNEGLYFSEGNGVSLLTQNGTQEMLGKYKKDEGEHQIINPITKFAFGDNFMVASGSVKGFRGPMFQIFRPTYEEGNEEIVKSGEVIHPIRFERKFIRRIPKRTTYMTKQLSLAAHQDTFAFTHHDWNRVFEYRMEGVQKHL